MTRNMIVILDFGSQYSQIIARKVRDMHVYCELLPWDVTADRLATLNPRGYILSGGPASVYAADAPTLNPAVLQAEVPVLGICYGMQVLAHTLGGEVASSDKHEYGRAINRTTRDNPLLDRGEQQVWMSHGDSVRTLPPGFQSLAESENCPITAMVNPQKNIYALQFHPEVQHTVGGDAILERFVLEICGCTPEWTAESIINAAVEKVRAQVGDAEVLSAVSGGVDSTVATALVQKAVGRQLHTVFVDHGLLRLGEREQVEATLRPMLGENLKVVDASERFLTNLRGVTEPEAKRKVIGETFIRVFEEQAREVGSPRFLVQGTIYPDVVESAANESGKAQRIKSHHNVGGLPKDMKFELVEPLRMLFKDEVRAIGEALGLPEDMVWRQPFPGPGLGVRCLGELTRTRLDTLRAADAIFTGELHDAGLLGVRPSADREVISQAFAALLPVMSVGVMGDQRTYKETIVLRAVTTGDFMTAHWTQLPPEFLARVSERIVNEVEGVNRVVYDITSKPPATIEWE